MRGDALMLVEDLDRHAGRADLDALADKRAQDAVESLVELNEVVRRHADIEPPLAQCVAGAGQCTHRGAIQSFEELPAALGHLAQRSRVEPLQELRDRHVQLVEAEEHAVAQARHDEIMIVAARRELPQPGVRRGREQSNEGSARARSATRRPPRNYAAAISCRDTRPPVPTAPVSFTQNS
jgi:hypothetical protein